MLRRGWIGAWCTFASLGCQATVTIQPPPSIEDGSLWLIGRGGRGEQARFVHASGPGEPIRIGGVAFDEAIDLWAVHSPCELEAIYESAGKAVERGRLTLRGEPQASRPVPAPTALLTSHLIAGGQEPWGEVAALPEEAQEILGRVPLPNDHGCQMAVTEASAQEHFLKNLGTTAAILHPQVFLAAGEGQALLAANYSTDFADAARIGYGLFQFPLDATDGLDLPVIEESTTATLAFFAGTIVGTDAWLARSGSIDRLDLSGERWTLEGGLRDPFTETTNLGRIEYQTLMAGSGPDQAPEILLLSTRIDIDSMAAVSDQRPTTVRRLDPSTRKLTELWSQTVQIRGEVNPFVRTKEIGLQRLGPGEALILGLDGANRELYHLQGDTITPITPPNEALAYGDFVRIYRAAAVGIVVLSRQGALFKFTLDPPTWTQIRAPYREGSEAAARGDLERITGLANTPEGFLLFGQRPGHDIESVAYRPGLGFCAARAASDVGTLRTIQVGDRLHSLEQTNGQNTLRVRVTSFGRAPVACAIPAGM